MTVLPPSDPPAVSLPAQLDDVGWPNDGWPVGHIDPTIADPLNVLLDQAFGSGDNSDTITSDAITSDAVTSDMATSSETADAETERFGSSLAFVAIHQGRLVAERYGPTAGPDEQLISWSMAKSITHALIGTLVGEGRLSIHDPAPIPAWVNAADGRAAITIDQMLRMVPGTLFNEDYIDDAGSHCIQMLFGDGKADMAAYTAALPAAAEPDTVFNYSSGTSVLLCRILADIVGSGEEFEAWMQQVLLDRLGIDARLTFDDAGTWVGSSFLHASARDFAKFGLLYLRDGVWNGERILPEGWVDYARTVRALDDEGNRYGSHWWINKNDDSVFVASGYETQRIIVDPAADLVLVRLGKTGVDLAPNVDAWLDKIRLLFPR